MKTDILRQVFANAAFEAYKFGSGVNFVDITDWDISPSSSEWNCTVFVSADDAPDADATLLKFVVRFADGTAYPLDASATGPDGKVWGSMPAKQYSVWCDEDHQNTTADKDEAIKLCFEFLSKGRDSYIVDELNARVKLPDETSTESINQLKSGFPKFRVAESLYELRNMCISQLKLQGSVIATDLTNLDPLGRFRIANEIWDICPDDVRESLLNDPHVDVRSAATASAANAGSPPSNETNQPAPTIRFRTSPTPDDATQPAAKPAAQPAPKARFRM